MNSRNGKRLTDFKHTKNNEPKMILGLKALTYLIVPLIYIHKNMKEV